MNQYTIIQGVSIKKELIKSIIKQSQHYGIWGVISRLKIDLLHIYTGYRLSLNTKERLLLRAVKILWYQLTLYMTWLLIQKLYHVTASYIKILMLPNTQYKQNQWRNVEESHGVTILKKLVEDQENWESITRKGDYQFPGVFHQQYCRDWAFYTPNCTQLFPRLSTVNPHYL